MPEEEPGIARNAAMEALFLGPPLPPLQPHPTDLLPIPRVNQHTPIPILLPVLVEHSPARWLASPLWQLCWYNCRVKWYQKSLDYQPSDPLQKMFASSHSTSCSFCGCCCLIWTSQKKKFLGHLYNSEIGIIFHVEIQLLLVENLISIFKIDLGTSGKFLVYSI